MNRLGLGLKAHPPSRFMKFRPIDTWVHRAVRGLRGGLGPFVFGVGMSVALSACSGTVAPDASPDEEPMGDGMGGSGGSPAGPPVGETSDDSLLPAVTASGLKCDTPKVGASFSRRLTNPEYDRTLRDLFPGFDLGTPSRELTFPADAFKGNFSNDASEQEIVQNLAKAYYGAAESVAAKVTADPDKLMGCSFGANGNDACLESFLDSFGTRAFRRPLTSEETSRLRGLYAKNKAELGVPLALASVVERILISPQFLYRLESSGGAAAKASKLDDWELASRVSYLVTGSMPDEALFADAQEGRLATDKARVRTHVVRLLGSDQAKDMVRTFFREWLTLDRLYSVTRPEDHYPTVYEGMQNDMMEEVLRFAEATVLSDSPLSFEELFTGRHTFVNARLAQHYGLTSSGEAFSRIDDAGRGAGVLSKGAILTASGTEEETKAIFRGKWMRLQVLCGELPPPPDVIPPFPELDETKTSRELLALHNSSQACSGCHRLMDPLGFPFDHFDLVGQYKETEHGLAIDTSGEITVAGDANGPFDDLAGLGERLAKSRWVKECLTRELFRYSAGRVETPEDACALRSMKDAIGGAGSLREALLAYVESDAFFHRTGN